MRKTLRLRRETLAALSDAQLESVDGGTRLTLGCTDGCWSVARCPVPTLPLRECPIQ